MIGKLLFALLLVAVLSTAVLGQSPPAHAYLSNMNLSLYMVNGDWFPPYDSNPYPAWWTIMAPYYYSEERYIITPQPGTGARPNITCGADSGGVWLRFDNPYAEGKVNAYGVVGGYQAAKVRASFDYDISWLPSGYQIQVWVRTYPETIPVWYSTSQYQQGHVSLERALGPGWYSGIDILLTRNLVPEPASASALLLGGLLAMLNAFRRRRSCDS